MAQIDAFLARLVESRAQRAIFHEDAPLQVQHENNAIDGSVMGGTQIQAFLEEILTDDQRATWEQTGEVRFPYQSPSGLFQIQARRVDGRLLLEMTPGEGVIPPPLLSAPTTSTPLLGPANDSGTSSAQLPQELKGFNFGAFLMSWIWAIGNRSWLGLIGLIPCIGFFARFWLGFKGNELAWKNRKWDSIQHFRKVQQNWMIAGIIFAGLGIFLAPMFMAVFFPVFARARENARRSSCQSNLKVIAMSLNVYRQEYNGQYPPYTLAQEWQAALRPHIPNNEIFRCPSDADKPLGYEFVVGLGTGEISTDVNPATFPLAFDSNFRHLGGANFAFVDGHIKWYKEKDAEKVLGF